EPISQIVENTTAKKQRTILEVADRIICKDIVAPILGLRETLPNASRFGLSAFVCGVQLAARGDDVELDHVTAPLRLHSLQRKRAPERLAIVSLLQSLALHPPKNDDAAIRLLFQRKGGGIDPGVPTRRSVPQDAPRLGVGQ